MTGVWSGRRGDRPLLERQGTAGSARRVADLAFLARADVSYVDAAVLVPLVQYVGLAVKICR